MLRTPDVISRSAHTATAVSFSFSPRRCVQLPETISYYAACQLTKQDTFGPKKQRKRPTLHLDDVDALAKSSGAASDKYEDEAPAGAGIVIGGGPGDPDGLRDAARHSLFEKGQSKRIWGELYKVRALLREGGGGGS